MASSFSVEIHRSAACPPANSATRHAMAWVAKIQPISAPENRSTSARYSASSGSHDPQMTYSRNIMTASRVVVGLLKASSAVGGDDDSGMHYSSFAPARVGV